MLKVTNPTDIITLIKKSLKEKQLSLSTFSTYLGVTTSSLSKSLNNDDIHASKLLKMLNLLGYEVLILDKRDVNNLEKKAYGELLSNSQDLRSAIKLEVINELKEETKKTFENAFLKIGSEK